MQVEAYGEPDHRAGTGRHRSSSSAAVERDEGGSLLTKPLYFAVMAGGVAIGHDPLKAVTSEKSRAHDHRARHVGDGVVRVDRPGARRQGTTIRTTGLELVAAVGEFGALDRDEAESLLTKPL